MAALLIGYARVSTDEQDLTAQRDALTALGVAYERIYVDHGLTGTNRARPGLREAMAACRDDTLVVTKLDRLARSLPDARAILEELTARQVKLNLGGSVHEYADIISIAGALQITGQPPGTMRIATDAETDERVRYASECAGDRAGRIQWHALIQAVVQTDDRWAAAAALARRFGNLMSTDEILTTPFVLIGTIEQMAEQILRNRERYGFTYYTVHGPYADTFAPVIERVHTIND